MKWMIREDQLDTEQRDFVNVELQGDGNIWIKGFAGSGKSVLLVHALRNTLQREPNAKVAVVVFTHALIDLFRTGMQEIGLSKDIPVMTYYHFCDNATVYDYIFCDEVQDLPSRVLLAMSNRSKKVFVAGDANQSIYEQDPRWRDPVVEPTQVGEIIQARAYTLNMIHRLSRSVIAAVQKLLPSMNIWGARRDVTRVDVEIRLCEASSEEEEVRYIYQEAQKGVNVGEASTVLFNKLDSVIRFANLVLISNGKSEWQEVNNHFGRPDFGNLNQHLNSQGIKLEFVGSSYGSLRNAIQNRRAIMMTYHSAKGLDFDNVFLPFLNTNFWLHPSRAEALFMVAMTRSRKNLYLTYSGYTHEYVDKFKDGCTEISISEILNPRQPSNQSGDIFDF